MAIFYDSITCGFYSSDFHEVIPLTAVEISEEEYNLLLDGQSAGLIISLDKDGRPALIEPEVNPYAELKRQIHVLETQQTPRRLREAALGDEDSLAFLSDLDMQIAALRAQLGG